MREVEIKLKFTTPCLGRVLKDGCSYFERDASGNILFMHSWWISLLRYGAQAFGKHQSLIDYVKMHSHVKGDTLVINKQVRQDVKRHEAFAKGSVVVTRALLPDGLPIDEFEAILKLAGQYQGISPFGWKDGYGLFEVVSVSNPEPATPDLRTALRTLIAKYDRPEYAPELLEELKAILTRETSDD